MALAATSIRKHLGRRGGKLSEGNKKTSLLSISEVFLQTLGVEITEDGPESLLKPYGEFSIALHNIKDSDNRSGLKHLTGLRDIVWLCF
jgi:hypothetical protein